MWNVYEYLLMLMCVKCVLVFKLYNSGLQHNIFQVKQSFLGEKNAGRNNLVEALCYRQFTAELLSEWWDTALKRFNKWYNREIIRLYRVIALRLPSFGHGE